ncbi:DUF1828 domain-containing protein [Mycoplana sp. MJR14]|uniref:DUF1828 domain-containing protein n=1 Tax=Mycoplana sp. MJR14 TaxID=3032583 RepID=UPI0023DCD114|nr:DUF1828 domain-containing protein [Mycoplana sp. MJR14]MDF1631981.1 DUF1828 domain-containing protein [Mycoplana sp. MJR14]
MKADLCRAFCDDITVTNVPAGLAVGTAFRRDDGDRISFYILQADDGRYRLEDDGATIPLLEGAGVDFETETRRRALDSLLAGVDAYFDSEEATIKTNPFPVYEVATRALNFVSVMIRMNDFLLLTQEKVISTFREDAAQAIRLGVGDHAQIREGEAVNARLSEVKPDMIVEAKDRPPVAIFFGNSPGRVHDAIFLHQTAAYEVKQDISVIALLEQDNSVPIELRRRATNRLTTVPVFRQDEDAAVARIVREALGSR